MIDWLFDLPAPVQTAIVVGVLIIFTWLGALIMRPISRWLRRGEDNWNGTIGAVLGCFGVFFGLLLGLLAVAAYQNAEAAEARVIGEASILAGVYNDLGDYAAPARDELKSLLREYVTITIEADWPLQRRGQVPTAGTAQMGRFLEKLHHYEPNTKGQEILHADVLRRCEEVRDLRRQRLYATTLGLPPMLWYVVALGTVINIALLWLMDLERRNHLVLGGLVALFLGTVISVIAMMDNPYRGAVSVGPEPFVFIQDHVIDPTQGVQP
jgi:hypothetical protein